MSSASIKEFQHLRISLQDLKSATNDFDETNCIGRGGFGKVYKGGIFLSGVLNAVAIKRLDRTYGQGTPEFWKEVLFLSQYKHENLVSLLGFCDENGENLLVYKYLSNRSLDLYLNSVDLSLSQRLVICVEAAMGLQYLHEPLEGSQQRVLHRDIKSANILLDHNWRAKIADFGLSKLSPANQQFSFAYSGVVGTMGYCDPVYAKKGFLTKESDVYSFGVVLFEVLCGRPSVQNYYSYNDIRRYLIALSRECYEKKKMYSIIHVGLQGHISLKCLEKFSTIAYRCTHIERAKRPTMDEVVKELKFALLDQVRFEIFSLAGSFMPSECGGMRNRTGEMGDSLACLNESIVGDHVVGQQVADNAVPEIAAAPTTERRRHMPHYVNFEAFNTVSKISVPEVKLQDIEVATNNFLMCIGEHEFGLMYKGELSILGKPTTSFLIKRFMDIDDNDGPLGNHVLKYFLDQVFELGGQPQSNVISMLGYCIEEKEKIIVYECPGRGRLDQYIRHDNSSSTTLTWLVRLKICAGAAHAVDHSHGIDFIYNDIESSKILVDDRWLAKVTDFLIYAPSSKGLDRGVDADHAYGAPEYINNGVPTDKTNVYSFGVVLFEVLCGRLCTEEVNGVMLSPKLIKDLYETMKLAEIVDPSLREEMISSSSLDKYSAIAYQCLLDDPQQRPSMADVAKELEELFRIEAFSTLSVPEVKLQEIKVATNNFDMCIGEHEFGKMYKGELSILGIPTTVLLKRYMNMNIDERSENHLTDHDGTLCRQPHQNAISILGFCIGKREKITIYEYPGRGRLDQYIRRSNNSSTTPLTWLLRLKICVGAAHAIDHAHSIHVIYSDIKSSKILVDDNWEAKVTDFLISTPGSKGLDTGVVADHAYGAPELINNGVRTDKTNVYSFGMVLFEVLCGRLCTEEVDGVMLSPKLIIDLYETMKLAEIVDPILRKEMISSSSLGKYSAIAYRCLLDDPQQRPSMADVAKEFVELIRMERIHQSTLQEVPLKEIQVATNYFQSYIGKHDCGDLIYEGELSITGIPTKVYILSFLEHSRRPMSYLETVGYLSELQNLTYISALGYCYEEGEKIIVYEHPEGGSLDQYIRHSSNTTLTWIQRLNICFRAACGLFQVHQRHIFQRAFRSANILLDTEQFAKVCDFMISAPNTSTSLGDIAADRVYGAPEVILSTGKASKEADVYAFGVVLFEVLCGRLFTEEVDGVMLSAQLIKDLIETKKLVEVVDPSLRKEMISSSSLDKYSAIAYRCLLDDPQQRPSLADVAKEFVELIRMEAFSIISVPEVKLQEIELATNNFEMCIGEHKCGKMYKGELSIPGKPTTVLLKRYMNIDELSESHFLEQDGTLCRQPHQNAISVLGFCMEKGEKITVYEYPGRGSLDQYIRRNNNSSTTSLTWLLRLKICAGAAHAVHHAHSICVIYTDIESSKILVDDKWEAKVTDFLISTPGSKGLDRHVIADHAYGAPEFINNGVPTDKTNVYSFGVVLFEILCGRLCTEEVAGVMLSPKLIIDLYETMKLDEFVDPSLGEEMISSSSLEKYSSIAYRCLLDDPQQRPSMADVAKELEELLDIESIHQGTLQEVSLKEIQVATNNFQLYIGKNPSGDLIYEGELSILGIPTKVYIIRFHEHSEHGFSYFKLLDMYSKLRHPNIFLTLGYCFEEGENIIVHRYPEGVSLDQYISRRRSDTTSLTWLQRLEICAGAGRGLSYTHSKGLCEPGFKSALIFLDDKWVAKIANTDISPQYSDKGADAYKSPEYNTDHGFETSESNVYTFGIVLFEVLCGRLCSEELDGYMLSAKLIKEFYEKKKLEEIVDPALLTKESICPDSLDTYSAIAYRCLHDDPQQRPSMDEVVLELEELLRIQLQL